jgi:hypothetical protein
MRIVLDELLVRALMTLAAGLDEARLRDRRRRFDAGRMSCAPWQSAHAATREKPSSVTLPWNVRRNESTTCAWHDPHSAVTSRRHLSVSAR